MAFISVLVQLLSRVQLFVTPMNCSTPGLPDYHQLPEFTQTHVRWVGDAIQPSHPLSSPSPPTLSLSQHQGLFKWVSSSHQVAKVLEFQLQHQFLQDWSPLGLYVQLIKHLPWKCRKIKWLLGTSILYIFLKQVFCLFLAMLGLHCCARAFSSCRKSDTLGCSAQAALRANCAGFSCGREWALGRVSYSSCCSQAPEHRLSSCGTRPQLLQGRWHLPGSGIEPASPPLAGGFFSHQGSPHTLYLISGNYNPSMDGVRKQQLELDMEQTGPK